MLKFENLTYPPQLPGAGPETDRCRERRKYISECLEGMRYRILFEQCYRELGQGCETCSRCSAYGPRRVCPMARAVVARMYRNGKHVPQSREIAYQLELMGMRQRYLPSVKSVAEALYAGMGCRQDIQGAADIYVRVAADDIRCAARLMQMAADDEIPLQMAIPFVARHAKAGDARMLQFIIGLCAEGGMGVLPDADAADGWIDHARSYADASLADYVARYYESRRRWHECYEWYCRLRELDRDSVSDDLLADIRRRVVVAEIESDKLVPYALDCLYGLHGAPRDEALAVMCLEAAMEQGSIEARGLAGIVHYEGRGMNADVDKGMAMLVEAADGGDLRSVYFLSRMYTRHGVLSAERWHRALPAMVSRGMELGDTLAYFIEGLKFFKARSAAEREKAYQTMLVAADNDMPCAQYYLYRILHNDPSMKRDGDKDGDYWLDRSAHNGYYLALDALGVVTESTR